MPTTKTECYVCKNMRSVAGDCHISCAKPDPEMTGNSFAIKNGWFYYPVLFDPAWKQKKCANFEEEECKS